MSCTGDCDVDDTVSIDEIILGINIAVGERAVAVCDSFDAGGDGAVSVDELVGAVNAALNGCGNGL